MLHRSHTRWEGSSLVIEWQMEREGRTVLKGKDVRTLEPDGTQRLVRDLEDAKSKTHSVIVLKKQAGNPG
jgi:outer membrane lipoprotein-sorting protein